MLLILLAALLLTAALPAAAEGDVSKGPTVLLILDGYGVTDETEHNAIALADTPVMDRRMRECPFVTGEASGLAVGLPDGVMGSSKVGHLNIGAGRIVYQDLTRITKAIEAVAFLDRCIGRVVEAVEEADGQMFICADHGNAEVMVDRETGEPLTSHTTNPVPFILVNYDSAYTLREGGCVADVAPTLLEMMGLEKPEEMTGESLLVRKPGM